MATSAAPDQGKHTSLTHCHRHKHTLPGTPTHSKSDMGSRHWLYQYMVWLNFVVFATEVVAVVSVGCSLLLIVLSNSHEAVSRCCLRSLRAWDLGAWYCDQVNNYQRWFGLLHARHPCSRQSRLLISRNCWTASSFQNQLTSAECRNAYRCR